MPVSFVKFGPGTLTLDVGGVATGSEIEIACQISSGGVQHEYEDTSEALTMLGGCEKGAEASRKDSLVFEHLADLNVGGLYEWLITNDLATVPFAYVPSTAAGASWEGSIQLRLPDGVQADEYGSPLAGAVTWPGVGLFTFTGAPTPLLVSLPAGNDNLIAVLAPEKKEGKSPSPPFRFSSGGSTHAPAIPSARALPAAGCAGAE